MLNVVKPTFGSLCIFSLRDCRTLCAFYAERKSSCARKVSMQWALQTVLWTCKYVHLMIAALQINWICCCLIDVSGQDWSKFEGFPNCCRLLDQFLQRACKTPSFCAQHARKRCRPWPWEFEFFAGFASFFARSRQVCDRTCAFPHSIEFTLPPTNHLYWSFLTLSSEPALLFLSYKTYFFFLLFWQGQQNTDLGMRILQLQVLINRNRYSLGFSKQDQDF